MSRQSAARQRMLAGVPVTERRLRLAGVTTALLESGDGPPLILLHAAVPHVKRTMGQLIKAGTKQIPDAELRRIAVPNALLWGRHDRFVGLGLGQAASSRLDWPLHVIDDAGHVPHIERPAAFLDALRTALGTAEHVAALTAETEER